MGGREAIVGEAAWQGVERQACYWCLQRGEKVGDSRRKGLKYDIVGIMNVGLVYEGLKALDRGVADEVT